MKALHNKIVSWSNLRVPGGSNARFDADEVKELAGSVADDGLIHPPLVRKRDMLVICGLDRWAAHRVAGLKKIEVRLCDATDEEVERLRLAENVFRRILDPGERKAALASLMGGNSGKFPELSEVSAEKHVGHPRGPRPSQESVERKKKAAAAGVSERTVRNAEKRKREAATKEAEQHGEPPPPPVETLGVELPDLMADEIRETQEGIDEIDRYLRAVQATLTGLKSRLPVGRWQHLHKSAHDLAVAVRDTRPASVCPYCKLTKLVKNCSGCYGQGYVVEAQLANMPAQLMDKERRLVSRDGRFVSYASVVNGA